MVNDRPTEFNHILDITGITVIVDLVVRIQPVSGSYNQSVNTVQCMPLDRPPQQRLAVHNAKVYLGADKKIYITKSASPQLVPLNGGFYQHPEFTPGNTSGFVTISGETPPTLRWVYLDPQTHEMRWGGKEDSERNICGPFDWAPDEERITLQGWEGWMAVRLPGDEKIAEELGVENDQGLWRL